MSIYSCNCSRNSFTNLVFVFTYLVYSNDYIGVNMIRILCSHLRRITHKCDAFKILTLRIFNTFSRSILEKYISVKNFRSFWSKITVALKVNFGAFSVRSLFRRFRAVVFKRLEQTIHIIYFFESAI